METYWISDDWKQQFAEAKIDTLTRLLMYTEGRCLSMHSRGSTFASQFPGGQIIFIKRDHFTFKKDMLPELLHFKAPVPKTIREWRIFQGLKKLGFTVPEVIAAGFRRQFGMATVGGIVMLALEGMPLYDFIAVEPEAHRREYAIRRCRETLESLQSQGIDWPDCKAEHFMLMRNGTVGILDLERVTFHHAPLPDKKCQKQLNHFSNTVEHALAANKSITPSSPDNTQNTAAVQ